MISGIICPWEEFTGIIFLYSQAVSLPSKLWELQTQVCAAPNFGQRNFFLAVSDG